ncbi:MAG: Flp pilus assembly complex ATPase component TadA [Desulfobacterales bacterium]|jgi:type II secretory ATPase GspE/PulE/Tfp pilus assembly ATPase PilB-like protein|nr:Flp pilus assembly complex ATPase component TadA [Desulfobacterales bacterium]
MEAGSMDSVAKTTNTYDSMIKSAEAYEAHGLFDEALVLYKNILAEVSELDEDVRKRLQYKIEELSNEIAEKGQDIPYDLSSEEVTHIKTGLSIGESAPEIFDSANAFKELGLYKEALSEYLKLFKTDFPIESFVADFIECMMSNYQPAQVIVEIEKIIRENKITDKKAAAINFALGGELSRRDYREQAIKCYESVQRIDPIYPKIKEKIESIQPDKRFDSRYDYMLRNKIVTTDQLQSALSLAKKTKKSVEMILMEQFKISKEDIGKSLSAYYNCPFKTFDPKMPVPYELLSNLKKPFLLQDVWVPIHWEIDHIEILMDDPKDLRKLDHAKALFNTNKFIFLVGIQEDIVAIINHFFAEKKSQKSAAQTRDAVEDFDNMPDIAFEEEVEDEEDQGEVYSESSGQIVRIVDQTIISAYRKGASDIHIEPNPAAKRTKIRFRIDGVCQNFLEVPITYSSAVISRIKIMSNLDISERRLPQDGKIKFKRKGIPTFELRVATLPTAEGQEDAVLRILASSNAMKVEDLSLTERNLKVLKKAISKPYGIVLCVGPTGSGKTTTLHSALGHINTPERKIWTAEDPVEITQQGLRQVEVKNKIGLDFARVMRSFLRADPDVIMVGEMRDFETASIGIEASLTGHLVFSTLHTNSAPETVTRLLDMGLNPLNFSDAFLAVLAQRLLRRLCKNCRKEYHPSQEEFDEIVNDYGKDEFLQTGYKYTSDLKLYGVVGCDQCNGTGYKGRMGIHELMEGSIEIKRMIKKQASAEELFIQAKREGMTTLMQDGILKVLNGLTDMNEVRRVCIA